MPGTALWTLFLYAILKITAFVLLLLLNLLFSASRIKYYLEKLYEEFVVKNFKSIKEFINGRSKIYLKAFCQANRLPIDTAKVSKDRIVDEVMRWMAQRKAISKKVT